jgi:AcrR family transcriptional regulator
VAANIKNPQLVRDRRRQLIEAALTVFLRKGYHVATVRDIGREAGFTQGTIYNYVRSKSDILYLVCDDVMRAYQEAASRAIEGVDDPADRLSRALRVVVAAADDHQDAIQLIFHESDALDRRSLHAILARVAEYIELFERLLADAARVGAIVPVNARLAANIVTFLPTMIALRRWHLKPHVSRETALHGVTEFLLRGLRASPADGRAAGGNSGRAHARRPHARPRPSARRR